MIRSLLLALLMVVAGFAPASSAYISANALASQPTDPEKAFQVSQAQRQGNQILVVFAIHSGFSLYKQSISFESTGVKVEPDFFPEGLIKEDPSFGRVEVYRNEAKILLPLLSDRRLTVRFQGCLDSGLCFEEQTRSVSIKGDLPDHVNLQPSSPGSLLWYLVAGILLSFTPCVLPTLPLLMHAIAGGSHSKARQASLGLTYGLFSALSYAALGLSIGYLGLMIDLRAALQSPIPILLVTLSLLLLAVMNLGIRLPGFGNFSFGSGHGISGNVKGGQFGNAALLGVMSTLILSPCVTAPLAGILLYIAQSGDPLYAGAALFTLGIGMSLPLLALAIGGKRFIPKSGSWLVIMKEGSACLLIVAAAINFSRLLSGPQTLMLLGGFSLAACLYIKARWPINWNGHFRAMLAFCLFAYGFVCIAGGVNGQDDWTKPLTPKNEIVDTVVSDSDQLSKFLQADGPKVLLLSADWCLNCKVLERELSQSGIEIRFPDVTWIKFDITKSTQANTSWLRHRNLYGPPALLFINSHGAEIHELRLVGNARLEDIERSLSIQAGAALEK